VNYPPPTPKVILTNFFAEPTVLLVPITSRDKAKYKKGSDGLLPIKTTCAKLLYF
jgi:hypothetical protein